MGILDDKTVVITGSSRGLGLAMARECAREGAAVVLSSRSPEAVEEAVARLRAEGRPAAGQACDVADLGQVEALGALAVREFAGFDVWINNAGVSGPFGPSLQVPPEDFVAVINTNILGTYHGSIVALRRFYPRRAGKLINILGRGETGAAPLVTAYTTSKVWVRSFTETLAKEYRDSGVGIYLYNPGLMITAMMTHIEAVAGFEKRLELLKPMMRMWANPPEVPARKVAWLASSATDGETGLRVRELTMPRLLLGALREGLRIAMRRPSAPMDFEVETVPPAVPLLTEAADGLRPVAGEGRA